MTEPEQWAVELARRAVVDFIKDKTDNPHTAPALTIQRAFEEQTRELREALEDLRATPYPPVEDPDDTLGSMLDNQAWIVLSHVASRIGQRDGIEFMERWQDAWAEGEVQKGYFSPHRGVAAWIARHCQLTPEARAALGEKP